MSRRIPNFVKAAPSDVSTNSVDKQRRQNGWSSKQECAPCSGTPCQPQAQDQCLDRRVGTDCDRKGGNYDSDHWISLTCKEKASEKNGENQRFREVELGVGHQVLNSPIRSTVPQA
jgi:hypothetical protein